MNTLPKTLVIAGIGALAIQAHAANIAHRYSFNDTGGAGTSLNDSVGGAHGTIVDGGANDATVGGGILSLTGGAKAASDWASFPSNIVTSAAGAGAVGQVSIEVWGQSNSAQNWSRVFSFGSATNNVMHMSWSRGTNTAQNEFRWNNTGTGNGNLTLQDFGPNVLGQTSHWVVTLAESGADTTATVFFNGNQVAQGTNVNTSLSNLADNDVWLGRSQWGDNSAHADYDEFRIYNDVLTPADVAASFAAGPNVVVPEPSVFALLGLGGLALLRRRR